MFDDDDDPKDYSCDPCEECCRDDNAISSSGKKYHALTIVIVKRRKM